MHKLICSEILKYSSKKPSSQSRAHALHIFNYSKTIVVTAFRTTPKSISLFLHQCLIAWVADTTILKSIMPIAADMMNDEDIFKICKIEVLAM